MTHTPEPGHGTCCCCGGMLGGCCKLGIQVCCWCWDGLHPRCNPPELDPATITTVTVTAPPGKEPLL